MVEGHQCHRVAAAHRRLLLGKAFQARSPNGRFKEGAAAINAKPLQRIEVHGKNLFYFFSPSSNRRVGNDGSALTGRKSTGGDATGAGRRQGGGGSGGGGQGSMDGSSSDDTVVMHVHFGMSGAFRTMSLPGSQPTETTRLELLNKEMGLVAHLSAMTVTHGSLALYAAKAAQLGPDPLREDADKELLWSKLARSRKPIGQVLMDQSMVAGVGNIYRAEILFKAGVHPETPAAAIGRGTFDRIWYHCVDLLQRGFVSGSIVTVDPEEAIKLGRPWTRRYIYNQKTCGRCKGPVRTWDMAARTVYCCENCQPLRSQEGSGSGGPTVAGEVKGTDAGARGGAGVSGPGCVGLSAARQAALAAARPTRVFPSHCAPDDPEDAGLAPGKLTVKELRSRLLALNLDIRGTKPLLVARLEAALCWQQPQAKEEVEAETKGREDAEEEEKEEEPPSGGVLVGQSSGDHGQLQNRLAEGHRMVMSGDAQEPPHLEVVPGPGTPGAAAEQPGESGAGGGGGDDGSTGRMSDKTDSTTSVDQAERRLCEKISTGELDVDEPSTAAPPPDLSHLHRLTVLELKARLRQLGRALSGTKPVLIQRLREALTDMTAGQNLAEAAVALPPTAQVAEAERPADMEAEAVAVPTEARAEDVKVPVEAATVKSRSRSGNGRGSKGRPTGVSKYARRAQLAGDPQPQPGPPGTPAGQPTWAPITPPEDQPDGGEPNPTATESIPAVVVQVATTSAVEGGGWESGEGDGGDMGVSGKYDIQPGTQRLQALMVSAKDAALEKLLAGENRAVEHVALEDDEVVDLLEGDRQQQRRGGVGGRGRKRVRATTALVAGNGAVEDEGEGPHGGDSGVEGGVFGGICVGGTMAALENGFRRKSRRIAGGRR